MKIAHIGMIGCGGISASHINAYRSLTGKIKVVAVCDAVEEKAKAAMQSVGAEAYHLDYAALLERKDIEAIDICLPHDLHSPVAVAAAEHGKHVFCEKPIARTLGEADAMITAAEKNGVKLQIGENYRFIPEVVKGRQLVREGAIGDVFLAKTDCVGFPTDLAPSVWKLDASRVGGGVVIDSGIHYVDILRWMVGEVSSVTAFLNRVVRREIGRGYRVRALQTRQRCDQHAHADMGREEGQRGKPLQDLRIEGDDRQRRQERNVAHGG